MPKESKSQRRKVSRVMREYKHGELKSGRGGKVKKRRQAIAIAMREAGVARPRKARKAKSARRRRAA